MQAGTLPAPSGPIPAQAGIGLRFVHLAALESARPAVALLEVHSENVFGLTPSIQQRLERLRCDYLFSLHGVGLSLGSADGLDTAHLMALREAARRYQPSLVSEHLCWNRCGGVSLPDLLPLPMNREALDVVAANIAQAQDTLGRTLVIENISAYLRYQSDAMPESEFLAALVRRTGCELLIDLNNLHVNQLNLGEDPGDLLRGIPAQSVAEYHLAGPTQVGSTWIDTHATPVPEAVWGWFDAALHLIGSRPTIVEWDQELPELSTLVAEAQRADRALSGRRCTAA